MNGHIGTERMNDLLDGLLAEPEEATARAHLEHCPRCADDFAALVGTVQALGELPHEARPPEGIWRGIEERIAVEAEVPRDQGAQVLELPVGGRGPRRFSLTLPQLAAAAVVVSLMSGALVWQALSGGSGRGSDTGVAAVTAESPSARVAARGVTGYEETVLQLEGMLEQGRDVLAPETLATLESSLRTIDEAIAEVRTALETDPSSELLARLLANHQRSKLRVLRQAALSVQPRS